MTEQNSDILNGAKEIGAFLNCTPRRAYYLLEKGLIPAFQFGQRWHARPSTLLAHIEKLEAVKTADERGS